MPKERPAAKLSIKSVAKPAARSIPSTLLPTMTNLAIPSALVEALPECSNLQPFFATQERLRDDDLTVERCWMGSSISSITRSTTQSLFATLHTEDSDVPIFLKRIHLLDPIRAIEGEYRWKTDGILSAPKEIAETTHKKMQDPLNEAYVDAVFALCANQLVSTKTSPHWCRCFGTMSGRIDKYLYNISDELAEFQRSSWWLPHQRKGLFRVIREDGEEELLTGSSIVQGAKEISEDAVSLTGEEFEEVGYISPPSATSEEVVEEEESISPSSEPSVALTAPRVRLKRMTDGSTESSSTTDSDGPQTFAEFSDFPVQLTLLERADGTMDDLLEEEEEDETMEQRWSSWVFQVIAALSCAQKVYGFIHNDLHTNNVMWSDTSDTHIIYKIHKTVKGKEEISYMKVPTFGKLMKIIDFGRASFTLPPEHGGFYISDAFFEGNDAAEQYNCPPFYSASNGPLVEPNPSFDLCRLSVSLLESLFPTRPEPVHPIKIMYKEGAKIYTETVSPLYNLLWGWLIDKHGKNVLRTPEGRERYPDFDLYKAIGSDVKQAVPFRQLDAKPFESFRIETPPTEGVMYNLYC